MEPDPRCLSYRGGVTMAPDMGSDFLPSPQAEEPSVALNSAPGHLVPAQNPGLHILYRTSDCLPPEVRDRAWHSISAGGTSKCRKGLLYTLIAFTQSPWQTAEDSPSLSFSGAAHSRRHVLKNMYYSPNTEPRGAMESQSQMSLRDTG